VQCIAGKIAELPLEVNGGIGGPLSKNSLLSSLFLIASCVCLRADIVNVGSIRMDADSPVSGLVSFVVSNVTGPGCDAFYNSCTTLFINSGLLQVNYLDSLNVAQTFSANLAVNFGPGETDPATFSDFTVDPTGWTIQSVTFSGSLSPASLFLFDGSSKTLQPQTFSASFSPSRFNQGETPFSYLTAIAGAPTVIPEPATSTALMTGCAAMFLLARLSRLKR
jgi:hypothetical protein